MRVLVFGNINSGKSYLAKQLTTLLPDYNHVELDDFRKQYGDNTVAGEMLAIQHFVDTVLEHPNAIIDFTGCGLAAEKLQKRLPHCAAILLVRHQTAQLCIKALQASKYHSIPYPKEYTEQQSVSETILTLQPDVELDALTKSWQKFIWQSIEVPFATETAQLAKLMTLEHQLIIEKIKKLSISHEQIISSIAYGSLGANSLSYNSDLDIFIETTLTPKQIRNYFEGSLNLKIIHSDLLGNKVTLRTAEGILIELQTGKSLEEIKLYYQESQINHVYSTVLKGESTVIKKLYCFQYNKQTLTQRSLQIAPQLYFLFCSLPKLLATQDTYKYHFHVSIMQHYAVQLEQLLSGDDQHNYLPKHSVEKITNFPWPLFETSATKVESKQYLKLQTYIIALFKRLEINKLIQENAYFTADNIHLHNLTH